MKKLSILNHNDVNHILPQHSPTSLWILWIGTTDVKKKTSIGQVPLGPQNVQNPSFRLWLKHPFLGRRMRKSRPSTPLWTPLQLQL